MKKKTLFKLLGTWLAIVLFSLIWILAFIDNKYLPTDWDKKWYAFPWVITQLILCAGIFASMALSFIHSIDLKE
jgi:membrane protease YdiL (CAAX protease family)